ncbi:hypothetical protein B9Z55_024222 [Caenorhabditis nigoni]|nr:hypothetical protein B9Z55_024222 [Caenorhabditis nigoni]
MWIIGRSGKALLCYYNCFYCLLMTIHTSYEHRWTLALILAKCIFLDKEWDHELVIRMIKVLTLIFRYAFLSAAIPKVLEDLDNWYKKLTHLDILALFIAYSTQKRRLGDLVEFFGKFPRWQANYAFRAATEGSFDMHIGACICVLYFLIGCFIFLRYSNDYLNHRLSYLGFIFLGCNWHDTFVFYQLFYINEPETVMEIDRIRTVMRRLRDRI